MTLKRLETWAAELLERLIMTLEAQPAPDETLWAHRAYCTAEQSCVASFRPTTMAECELTITPITALDAEVWDGVMMVGAYKIYPGYPIRIRLGHVPESRETKCLLRRPVDGSHPIAGFVELKGRGPR